MPRGNESELERRTVLKGIGAAGGAALTAGLAGCSGNGGGDGGGSSTSSGDGGGDTETAGSGDSGSGGPVSHQLGFSHFPTITNGTALVTGMEKGFFEDHGVSISEVTSFSGGGTATRGITTGGLGIGGSAVSGAVQGFMAGATVRLVGMYMQSNGTVFQTQPDSPYETIQDLKGQKVAVTNPGSVTESAIVVSAMNAEGMSLSDIEIVYAGGLGESLTMLTEGKVAASMNIEPVSTQYEQQGKARTMFRAMDFAPSYSSYCILASDSLIQNQPEVVDGVVKGLHDAYGYVKDNVEESAKLWAAKADVDEDIAVQSVKNLNPEVMYGIAPEEDGIQTAEKVMKQLGKIDSSPPWSEIIDQQFMPEDVRAGWLE